MRILTYIYILLTSFLSYANASNIYPVVMTEDIGNINLDLIGISNSELSDLWQEQSAKSVLQDFTLTPDIIDSPYRLFLMSDIFLSPSPVEQDQNFLVFKNRAQQLLNIGKPLKTIALLELISQDFWDEDIAEIYINALFLDTPNDKACTHSQAFFSKYKSTFFEEVFNFCQLSSGQETAASIGLAFLKENSSSNSLYTKIADNILNDTKYKIKFSPNMTGFEFAIAKYAKLDISKELLSSKYLWALALNAREDLTSYKKALNLDIVSPQLHPQAFPQDFSITRYSEEFRKASSNNQPYLLPNFYKEHLKSIRVDEANFAHASIIIKSLLLLQEYSLAFEWYKKSNFLSNRNEEARRVFMLYGPIFKLLRNYGESSSIILDKYISYKKSSNFNLQRTQQEEELLNNIFAPNIKIKNPALSEALKLKQKGHLLFSSLQLSRTSPHLIDEIYHALKQENFLHISKFLTIETLLTQLDFGE